MKKFEKLVNAIINEAKSNENIASKTENMDFPQAEKKLYIRYFCLLKVKKYSEAEIAEKLKKANVNNTSGEQFNGILTDKWIKFETDLTVRSAKNALKELVIENNSLSDWAVYTKRGVVKVSELTEKDQPIVFVMPRVFAKSENWYNKGEPTDYYINTKDPNEFVARDIYYDRKTNEYKIEEFNTGKIRNYADEKYNQFVTAVKEFCQKMIN